MLQQIRGGWTGKGRGRAANLKALWVKICGARNEVAQVHRATPAPRLPVAVPGPRRAGVPVECTCGPGRPAARASGGGKERRLRRSWLGRPPEVRKGYSTTRSRPTAGSAAGSIIMILPTAAGSESPDGSTIIATVAAGTLLSGVSAAAVIVSAVTDAPLAAAQV